MNSLPEAETSRHDGLDHPPSVVEHAVHSVDVAKFVWFSFWRVGLRVAAVWLTQKGEANLIGGGRAWITISAFDAQRDTGPSDRNMKMKQVREKSGNKITAQRFE